jgi:hypothetical protein
MIKEQAEDEFELNWADELCGPDFGGIDDQW